MPLIRPSRDDDLPAIARIYRHHVLHSTATFETEPPDEDEISRRRAEVLARGLPWLVAETDNGVMGYAYGNWFKPRGAYRHSIEDSIYLDPQAVGQGLGRALLGDLLQRCEALDIRRVLAVIGGSDNLASIGLHLSLGFEPAGRVPSYGWKFGRWLDLVFMQKSLGDGDRCAPHPSPAP
jgi:L-amino acid N-acyltransferase YncA